MTKVVAIASGKGGVGKTTVAINLATALTQLGLDNVVVDADLDTPGVGLRLGSPKLEATLHSVLVGKNAPRDALYIHSPSGTRLVPGSLAMDHGVKPEHLLGLKRHVEGLAHVALIDTASGLGPDSLSALKAADEVIVVTTADMPSVIATLKTVSACRELGSKVRGVIINRHKDGDMEPSNVEAMLGVPLLATLPEDYAVSESIQMKHPVMFSHPEAPISEALKQCASSLIRYG